VKPVYTSQPRLILVPSAGTPQWLQDVLRGLLRWLGVGLMIQDNHGGLLPFRYNIDDSVYEVYVNGEWRV